MILIDTDHLSILSRGESPTRTTLMRRIEEAGDAFVAVPVISVEEQCRGRLAEINRVRNIHQQVSAYAQFAKLFIFLSRWPVALFDERAADEFIRLRKERIRVGTQDLKIAAIALMHGALLLSANLRDFRRVPGLRVKDWLQ